MNEEFNGMPEVAREETNRGYQPEVVEVKQGSGYQPEVVGETVNSTYQPEAIEANRNEYIVATPVEPARPSFIPQPETVEPQVQYKEEPKAEVSQEIPPVVTQVAQQGTPVVNEAEPAQEKAPVYREWNRPVEPAVNVSPDPVQPEVAEVKVEPEVVEAEIVEPEVVEPEIVEPEPVQPEAVTANVEPEPVQPSYIPSQPAGGNPNPPKNGKKKKEKKEKKGPNFFVKALMAIFFGILFGVFAGAAFLGVKTIGEKFLPGTVATVVEPDSEIDSENNSEENSEGDDIIETVTPTGTYNVVEVAQNCMPSIVIINVQSDVNYYGTVQEVSSSGSGIIVGQNDSELLIATNYHVIAGEKSTSVQFCDGSTAPATVKGKKVDMDLAVIAVDLSTLGNSTLNAIDVATIGDSTTLQVGETAIAIGNALGYGQSVTVGVISALNREVTTELGEANYFIQTDAAINPGNSGGALINLKGEVIGINSAKLGGSQVEGMGYAIPISEAMPIIDKLMEKQELVELPEDQQSFFGIMGSDVKSGLYTNEGVSIPTGIYVNQVQPGTSADEAGLQSGDIIVEFEGDSVTSMDELKKYLAAYPAGSKVKIKYKRYENFKFEEHEVEVTLQNKSNMQTQP